MALVARVPNGPSSIASFCIHHDEKEDRFVFSVELDGQQALTLNLSSEAFEELIDAAAIVFLQIHPHVHTSIPCNPTRRQLNRWDLS